MNIFVYLNYLPNVMLRIFSESNFIKPDEEWIEPADVSPCGSSAGPGTIKYNIGTTDGIIAKHPHKGQARDQFPEHTYLV